MTDATPRTLHMPAWPCPACTAHTIYAVDGDFVCHTCGWSARSVVPTLTVILIDDDHPDSCTLCGEYEPGEDDFDTCDHETGHNCMWHPGAPDWEASEDAE
jgi:hypothetical protein